MAEKQLSVGELAAAVVANDPEIRDQLKGLVADIVGHMRYTMRHGDPQAKLSLVKAVTPQLLSAINKVDQGESRKEQEAAYRRLMGAFSGDGAGGIGISAGDQGEGSAA